MLSTYLLISYHTLDAEKISYKRWLNEDVYWIITPDEKEAFKKLKTDKERDYFMALFWARRDPTPATEKNEFKEAYYSRLNFVNQKYTRAQDVGWKTDAGKILIFFGLPSNRKTNPETWIYNPIPYLKIDEEFSIVFDMDEDVGLVLNQKLSSMVALDAIDRFAERTIFNPDLKEIPDYNQRKAPSKLAEERQILDRISSGGEVRTGIPLAPAFYFSKAEDKRTSLSLVLFLDRTEVKAEEYNLFARINIKGGNAEDYFRKISLKEKDYYVESRYPLAPGVYQLVFGLRDSKSGEYSVFMREIEVPDFWTDRLNIGNLILSDRVELADAGSKVDSAFNFGPRFVYPKKDTVFNKKDTLNAVYHIYNAQTENRKVRLLQDVRLTSATRTYRLPDSLLEDEVAQGQIVGAGVPIPLSPIEPGEYELQIKITDQISGQVVENSIKVVIRD